MRNLTDDNTEEIGFLLVPEFPVYALILVTEALRVANQNAGRRLFDWHLISLDGGAVKAGSGMPFKPDLAIAQVPASPSLSKVIVCSGNHPLQYIDNRLLNWLRRLDRHGVGLGALDTGAFALAAAGLLGGYRATLHWEAIPMFREKYPQIDVVEQLFVLDRNRLTCAGGVAALDMMLHLIAMRFGSPLARVVANGFIHTRIGREADAQRLPVEGPAETAESTVQKIIRAMEQNLDPPMTPAELAEACGVSIRSLERITRRKLGDTPMRYYQKIRLRAARNLLFYSDMSIRDISLSCGFSSPPVFTRAFHAQYGQTPREYRSDFSTDELRRFYPEFVQRMNG
jgi:AraC family carnitine catabolism transcriptional activator